MKKLKLYLETSVQKIPKALKEVWRLKDKCYEETKHMSSKEYVNHVHR